MRISLVLLLALSFMALTQCKEKKKYHDVTVQKIPSNQTDGVAAILKYQQKVNADFKNPETSPLPDRLRKDFESLEFFAPDTTYIVNAKLVRTPNALPFMMPTTTSRESEEVVYAVAHFTLNGAPRQLEIYLNSELQKEEGFEDYLFLPFTDLTNGEETYGGGRYLDLKTTDADEITLDFNKAYSPYCEYNKKYSCPIVPEVNFLNTRVLAGVKVYNK